MNIQITTNVHFESFIRAATNGNVELLKHLLDSHSHYVNWEHLDRTAIHYAVEEEQVDIVKTLIAHQAQLDRTNYNDKTPFQMAMENKSYEIAQVIGQSQILYHCEKHSSLELLKKAIEAYMTIPEDHRVALKDIKSEKELSLAELTALNGFEGKFDYLMSHGVSLNIDKDSPLYEEKQQAYRFTTKQLTVSCNSQISLDIFINAMNVYLNIDYDAKTKHQYLKQLMSELSYDGQRDKVAYLLKQGVEVQEEEVCSVLRNLNINHNKQWSLFELLLQEFSKSGKSFFLKVDELVDALCLAISSGRLSTTKLILKNHPNIINQFSEGFTPLMWAEGKNSLPLIKTLLDYGANPELRDEFQNKNAIEWIRLNDKISVTNKNKIIRLMQKQVEKNFVSRKELKSVLPPKALYKVRNERTSLGKRKYADYIYDGAESVLKTDEGDSSMMFSAIARYSQIDRYPPLIEGSKTHPWKEAHLKQLKARENRKKNKSKNKRARFK